MREYVLWGRPAGSDDALDDVVLTCTPSLAAVERVKLVAARDGFHSMRLQVLDGQLPDFARCV